MMETRQKKQVLADAGLLAVAAIWGANFVIIKAVLGEITPMLYLGVRFSLAFALMFCFCGRAFLRTGLRQSLQALAVGVLLFGGFAAQTAGLNLTTPGVSGFLTVTYVVIVPLVLAVKEKKLPRGNIMVGAVLTLLGVGLLSLSGSFSLGSGELLTLICALFFALHILALDQVTGRMDSLLLTAWQMGTVGMLSLGCALVWEPLPASISPGGWLAILYGVFGGSIAAYFGQTVAQRYTPPAHAAIILSLEAAFALLVSILYGMDVLSARYALGFVLVLAGVLAVEASAFKKNQHYSFHSDSR